MEQDENPSQYLKRYPKNFCDILPLKTREKIEISRIRPESWLELERSPDLYLRGSAIRGASE